MKLIIAADDFGFSEAYSIGALKACKEGVATVIGLMANMPFAEQAVRMQKETLPGLCLALHTNFVQGAPCSPPKSIPSLVDESGMFRKSAFYKSGQYKIDYADARKETSAQMERFKQYTGAYPIHVEGHSIFDEEIFHAIADAASSLGAHYMDMTGNTEQRGYRRIIEHTDAVIWDIVSRGVSVDDFLDNRFGFYFDTKEIHVLHFHPGFIDQYLLDNTTLTLPRCKDLQTLCDRRVRDWLASNGITLVDYHAAVLQGDEK